MAPTYWDADPQPAIARIAEDHFGRTDLMDRVDALSM